MRTTHGTPGLEPFRVHATPAELADLRARLHATRWPDAPEDAGWSIGTDLSYLRELVVYWAGEFDWPAQEAAAAWKAGEGAYAEMHRTKPSYA
jgi:hypothetical protein